MKHLILAVALAAAPLSACVGVPKDALHAIGDLAIAEGQAQVAFNAAKPRLTAAQAASGQKALDDWLAGLLAADAARKAGDTVKANAALSAAASAQADALKIIPKP